ncbi:MFS transporter [Sansalvadorimonas sp. 2012CJ34-2]|uniref:MFS transporter n=1 Tax=Parendozoicomonas callyspongiae TaxID=2942213 RepID=A0ABT0PGC5_9GAMM|nr:MFS transporter [Sansalvadorimonas sp. 2012CJ34-2]MCL6270071.1 MFS transporter [Sansalvadorimonas sp. 2012CJ34-2]
MNSLEVRAASSLSLVFALRMLGLFMLLPVLAVYADELRGATPALIGLAIGAYGISQSLLQIPAGLLSDRIGRKPVIIGGLLIFVAGSLLAGSSDTITNIIAGRFLQGAGAIAAAVTALLADLTREENRTRAMAMVGISIGLSFCVAMVLGPLLVQQWGLAGLFNISAVMAVGAIALVAWAIPTPVRQKANRETVATLSQLREILGHRQLLRLNAGVFTLHFVLMLLFMQLPLALQNLAGLPREEHWWVYLVTMVISFFAMVPFIVIGEKKRMIRPIMIGVVTLLFIAQGMIWANQSNLAWLVGSVLLFFMAFNYLEATMPSVVSRIAPAGSRGTAMGAFATCQFLGAGLGGIIAGLAYQLWGGTGIFVVGAIATAIWWLLSVTMNNPPYVSSIVLDLYPVVPSEANRMSDRLAAVAGVKDVTLIVEEQTAYLKIDKQQLDEQHLRQYGDW